MNNKFKILFVCTDNFGRSVIAEYCLKDYLQKHQIDNMEVSSAGTNASSNTSGFSVAHIGELKKLGIDVKIDRIQLTKALADQSNLIICFDEPNKTWIKENLDLNIPLFNEAYKNESDPISCKSYPENMTLDEKMIQIADYIYKATPVLREKIQEEYI